MAGENTQIRRLQGGDTLEVGPSGIIDILTGGEIRNNGTQASAVPDLTDNSAGTADDTIQALTDPADAPASADALRDDLVANLIPELRNNIADLTAKVNDLIAAVRGGGLVSS